MPAGILVLTEPRDCYDPKKITFRSYDKVYKFKEVEKRKPKVSIFEIKKK